MDLYSFSFRTTFLRVCELSFMSELQRPRSKSHGLHHSSCRFCGNSCSRTYSFLRLAGKLSFGQIAVPSQCFLKPPTTTAAAISPKTSLPSLRCECDSNLSFRNPPGRRLQWSTFVQLYSERPEMFLAVSSESSIPSLSSLVSGLERSQFFKRPIKGSNGE